MSNIRRLGEVRDTKIEVTDSNESLINAEKGQVYSFYHLNSLPHPGIGLFIINFHHSGRLFLGISTFCLTKGKRVFSERFLLFLDETLMQRRNVDVKN